MKKSELRKIIKEEIKKTISEKNIIKEYKYDADDYLNDINKMIKLAKEIIKTYE